MAIKELTTPSNPINEEESAQIVATLYDASGAPLVKASINSLTLTLTDSITEVVINSRDESNILDANGGTVAADGTLTFNLTPADNPILGTVSPEFHKFHLEWKWDDLEAVEQTGIEEGFLRVVDGASATTLFTSLEEIERVYSEAGVANHSEDYADNTEVIDEIIMRATETVLQFLRGRYSESGMINSYWVRMKATFIACYYLSVRQGNPSLYGDLYAESMLDLAQARDGIINPGLVTGARVILQTPMMDSRFFQPGRINQNRSTKVFAGQRLPYRLGNYE